MLTLSSAIRTILLECGERTFNTSVNAWHSRGPATFFADTTSIPSSNAAHPLRLAMTNRGCPGVLRKKSILR